MSITKNSLNFSDYVIGIDIGGTYFRIGAITQNKEIIDYSIEKTQSIFKEGNAVNELSKYINAYLKKISKHGALKNNFKGICIGIPGTVSKDNSFVFSCPNLLFLNNKDIGYPLSQLFNVPVIIEHDVVLLLAYDMFTLDLDTSDCIMAIYVGTGLGNAMYIHGQFLKGKNGASGELGHIPLNGGQDLCPCGNIGCIELYCAGKCLEKIRDNYFSDIKDFNEIFILHKNDPIIQNYINFMAMAISTEINILDPDYIVISGGVVNMPDFPYESLISYVRAHTRKPFPEKNLNFVRSMHDAYAGILGAGIYFWDMENK